MKNLVEHISSAHVQVRRFYFLFEEEQCCVLVIVISNLPLEKFPKYQKSVPNTINHNLQYCARYVNMSVSEGRVGW